MKIFVSGPYSSDPEINVNTAIDFAERLAALGHIAYVPHLTHYWELRHHHAYRFWMDQDKHWLHVCDAVLRIPGESKGADEEVSEAKELGMTIYTSIHDVPKAWEDVTDTPRKLDTKNKR